MKFLRTTLLTISLIILLAGIKTLCKKLFPSSIIFHYNLFSSLQLLALLWLMITGLLETVCWKKQTRSKARFNSFLTFLTLIVLAEGACFGLLHQPQLIPTGLIPGFHIYYNNYHRDILQYNRSISRYDSTLFYRLKSDNRTAFSNIEFSDSIFTNGQGFRNDKIPAGKEKIMCLGDSYTLGWGVEQNETYPSQLEKIIKMPVLNTAMSSYGTVRETEIIRSLDKTDLSTVIIQYCNNDSEENEAYIKNHFRLAISPESTYDSAVDFLKWSNTYFPGKYFCTLFKICLNKKIHSLQQRTKDSAERLLAETERYDLEAFWFTEVLKRSGMDFKKVHVFVFDIGDYESLSDKFELALGRQLNTPDNQLIFKNHVQPVLINSLLTKDDYYQLDEHIRASGQRKIASRLAEVIQSVQP